MLAALIVQLALALVVRWADAAATRVACDLCVIVYRVLGPEQASGQYVTVAAGALAAVLAFWSLGSSEPKLVVAGGVVILGVLSAAGLIAGAVVGWLVATPDRTEQLASTRRWLGDTAPPQIVLAAPPAPVRGAAPISLAVSDEGAYTITRFTIDNIAVTPAELINLDTSSLPDGEHRIVVEAEDTSRQRNRAIAQAIFRTETQWWQSDRTPPVITITVPSSVTQGMTTLGVITWDQGEHRIVSITLDGAALPLAGLHSIDTRQLPDGEHTIVVEAEDASRQRNRAQSKAVFRSDNNPPSVTIRFDPPAAPQGHVQVIYITVNEPASAIGAALSGRSLPLARSNDAYWAVVGFDPDAKTGVAALTVWAVDALGQGTTVTATQTVTGYAFPVQNVTGEVINVPADRAYLLDPAISVTEINFLDTVFAVVTPQPLWQGAFGAPIAGRQTSPFAIRRSYNGGPPGSYHGGMDIAANMGDPVQAANRGRVALAEALKVRGNAVIIDHGLGVYSCYYHLSEIRVQKGQMIEKGQVIGLVGSTGLSTGPHLHWEMRVTGNPVNPIQWTQRAIP
jgi:murein DD-endopeptidase MepM/ murein hydrolase activator NlpD